MQFRGSGQRDSRRRRVLLDDREAATDVAESAANSKSDVTEESESTIRPYSALARRLAQPRTVDLLPKSTSAILGISLVLAMLVFGGGWLHQTSSNATIQTLSENASAEAASETDAPTGSIKKPELQVELKRFLEDAATWLGSSLLLVCVFLSLQILNLRRHKSSDYRGTYQVWIWLAGFFLIASLCMTARVIPLLDAFFEANLSLAPPISGLKWSVGCIAFLIVAVTIRMWFEFNNSRLAYGSMAAGLGLLAGSLSFQPDISTDELNLPVAEHEISRDSASPGLSSASDRLTPNGKIAPQTIRAILTLSAMICFLQGLLFQFRTIDRLANQRHHLLKQTETISEPALEDEASPVKPARRKRSSKATQIELSQQETQEPELAEEPKSRRQRSQKAKHNKTESKPTESSDDNQKSTGHSKAKSSAPKLKLATRVERQADSEIDEPEMPATISLSRSQRKKQRRAAKASERRAA